MALIRRAGGLSGRRLVKPSAAAAVLLAVAAVSALAAKPESGCWGYCGGPVPSHTPYFQVQNNHVEYFNTQPMACLGTYRGSREWIEIQKKLPITAGDGFSFHGQAVRVGPGTKVGVKLTGRFVSATKAKGALMVMYKKCGTQHFTVRRVGG